MSIQPFTGSPAHLATIHKAVICFDLAEPWPSPTSPRFCYLDIQPDIQRLFAERHFDYCGKNLIDSLQAFLEKNPVLITSASLREKDLATKIDSVVLPSITLILPRKEDSILSHLRDWIFYGFGQGAKPVPYQKYAYDKHTLLNIQQLLSSYLTPISGGYNRYPLALIIQHYLDDTPTANPYAWYGSDDIHDYLSLIIEKELGGWYTFPEGPTRFLLQRSRPEKNLIALLPPVDTSGSSLPISYFLDSSLQPVVLLPYYEQILPYLPAFVQVQPSLEQLNTLLAPIQQDTVQLLLIKLQELHYDQQRIANEISKLRKAKVDVFQELAPFFSQPKLEIIILIPYNRTQAHWLTAEIQISKQAHAYQITLYAHDPYGAGRMAPKQVQEVEQAVQTRVKTYDREAICIFRSLDSPYPRRQALEDSVSCGVIVVEDIVKRLQDLSPQEVYPIHALAVREQHIEKIQRYFHADNPTRKNFLRRNLQSEQALPIIPDIAPLLGKRVTRPTNVILNEEEQFLAIADAVAVDPQEIEKQKKEVRIEGLGIDQTASALKVLLKLHKDVLVLYHKEIQGTAFDNQILIQEISRIVTRPKQIVFPYAINKRHQVAIVIDLAQKSLTITDSLRIARFKNRRIQALKNGLRPHLGDLHILMGRSNYHQQPSTLQSWECGIHTIHNMLDQIAHHMCPQKTVLELDKNLDTILIAAFRYKKFCAQQQEKLTKRRLEKSELLGAIEKLRDKKGHFIKASSDDDLRKVADALQIELWGNIQRHKQGADISNSGRALERTEELRERAIEKLIEQYEKERPEDIFGIIVLNVLKRGGKYQETIEFHRKALEKGLMSYSLRKKDRADQLHNLGVVFFRLGKYVQAHESLQEALELLYKKNGGDSDQVAASLNNIGTCYARLGEPKKAFEYCERALAIWQKVYGEEHPNVAASLNNIGALYAGLGEYKRALEYYERALAIWQRVYGEEHPDVATSLNNIGALHAGLGEYKRALEYYERALAIWQRAHGEEHPDVAASLNDIGALYVNLGEFNKALECLKRALAILQKVYGEEHPDVATSLDSTGMLYVNFEQPKKAFEYYERALAVRKAVYGEEHPDVATSLNNVGMCYLNLGKPKQALGYFERAFAIRKKVYGEEHLDIATSLNNIGLVYANLREPKQALEYCERALAIWQRVYGKEHPNVAKSLNNIGTLYADLGKTQQALEYCERALAIWQRYGEEHPEVAKSLNNIGALYAGLGEYKRALEYYERALAIWQRVYGEAHPRTLLCKKTIEIMRKKSGNSCSIA